MSTWPVDPLALARFVHFAGCVVATGTAVFAVLAAPSPPSVETDRLRRRWDAFVCAGAATAAVSGLAWLVVVSANIVGVSVDDLFRNGGLWSVASGTQFGQFAVARLVLALLLLVPTWTPRLRLFLALGLIVLIAPAGHAGAEVGIWGNVHLIADAAHLAAAGAWLGGLPALAALLGAAHRNPAVLGETAARTTARFSWLGIACVGTLIATGLANSWFLLSGPGDLLTTDYGRLLTLKIGLFAIMIGIAAVNRVYLTPQLPATGALRVLQWSTLGELLLGAGILLAVAILGTMEPAAGHSHTVVSDNVAFVHIHGDAAMADVTIDPGRAQRADVRIHLAKEDLTAYTARAVRVELRPPEADIPNIAREANPGPDATWDAGGIAIPCPGIWTVVVTITPPSGAIVVLDGPIVIAP